MWLLLRLVMVGVFAAVKYRWRNRKIDGTVSWRGEIVYQRETSNNGLLLGFAFQRPLVFELLKESRSDRFLKGLGLIVEQQAGDFGFDSGVYIRSDNPVLGGNLGASAPARIAVLDLFRQGVRRIVADGIHLWIELPSASAAKDDFLASLHSLRENLAIAVLNTTTERRDASLWRVAAAETFVWVVAAYVITGLPDLIGLGLATPDWTRLSLYAVVGALALGVLCWTVLVFTLRRSSWAKKIYLEASLVLAVSVPLASIIVISDINRVLDQSVPHVDSYQIIERRMSAYTRPTLNRGPVTIVEYFVRVQPRRAGCPEIKRFFPVSYDTYNNKAALVEVTWGGGVLGFPWIDSIKQEQKTRVSDQP